jgi:hypothetical protein
MADVAPVERYPYPYPDPKDPTYCPACLSGIGPTDPNDPILKIAEPISAAE